MPAPRGQQQRGRSGEFPKDRMIRAELKLPPGDPLRPRYESLVLGMGVSGAEVLRYALSLLTVDENGRPLGWTHQEDDIAKAS